MFYLFPIVDYLTIDITCLYSAVAPRYSTWKHIIFFRSQQLHLMEETTWRVVVVFKTRKGCTLYHFGTAQKINEDPVWTLFTYLWWLGRFWWGRERECGVKALVPQERDRGQLETLGRVFDAGDINILAFVGDLQLPLITRDNGSGMLTATHIPSHVCSNYMDFVESQRSGTVVLANVNVVLEAAEKVNTAKNRSR
jgi:hypothetical protein